MNALTRDEVRRVDRLAIDALGVSGLVLMENAGRNAADAIERFACGTAFEAVRPQSPKPAPRATLSGAKIAVVAGAGNNGGDGYVVARHLAMRGASVVTFLVAQSEKISGDAAINLNIIRKLGHDIRQLDGSTVGRLAEALCDFDVIVDAVGGTGINGPLRGDMATAVAQINAAAMPVVAIDIPTGLDCDSGQPFEPTVKAAMTVTFVARKKGFDAPGASQYTGQVVVADIGIPAEQVLGMRE